MWEKATVRFWGEEGGRGRCVTHVVLLLFFLKFFATRGRGYVSKCVCKEKEGRQRGGERLIAQKERAPGEDSSHTHVSAPQHTRLELAARSGALLRPRSGGRGGSKASGGPVAPQES